MIHVLAEDFPPAKSAEGGQLLALLAKFGLTPSDRTKVSVEVPKESALDKFLAGHTPPVPKLQ